MPLPFTDIEGIEISGRGLRTVKGRGGRVARYALTHLGSIRAENGEITGAQGDIASALENDSAGVMTKRELAKETRMEESRVGHLLKKLEKQGYVEEKVGG